MLFVRGVVVLLFVVMCVVVEFGICGLFVVVVFDMVDGVIDIVVLCRMFDWFVVFVNVYVVLIVCGGKLVFECYLIGFDEVNDCFIVKVIFGVDMLYNMKLVFKIEVFVVFGIVIDWGLVLGVDELIFNFFLELVDLWFLEKDCIWLLYVFIMLMGL